MASIGTNNSIRVKRVEYITDLLGSDTLLFSAGKPLNGLVVGPLAVPAHPLLINPGNATLFPFLSKLAVNFENYKFKYLKFYYRSIVASSLVSNSQVGSVVITYLENPVEVVPSTKTTLLEHFRTKSYKISDSFVFDVPCHQKDHLSIMNVTTEPLVYKTADDAVTTYPTFTGNLLHSNEDCKSYYMGNLVVATNQCSILTEVGELWVEYDVELMRPHL